MLFFSVSFQFWDRWEHGYSSLYRSNFGIGGNMVANLLLSLEDGKIGEALLISNLYMYEASPDSTFLTIK